MRRVISYRAVRERLKAELSSLWVYFLWQDVFGEDKSDCDDVFWLEREFMKRVDTELFPLDELLMSDFMGFMDEAGMDEYIVPVSGCQIPFAVASVQDMLPHQMAAGAALQLHRLADTDDWFMDRVGYPAEVWWMAPWATMEAWKLALDWFVAQGPPWDGLGQMVFYSLQEHLANPFLGLPQGLFVEEYLYGGWDQWQWTVEHIRLLQQYWAAAKPIVEQIEAFAAWFSEQDEMQAHHSVMAMLERCGDETEEMVDGELKLKLAKERLESPYLVDILALPEEIEDALAFQGLTE